jgi:fatty-acyl-CoA synthase
MIIRGGENIYPKEIEEFLFTHEDIQDVQVIGVPSIQYGEEVMACVILKPAPGLPNRRPRITSAPTWRAIRCPNTWRLSSISDDRQRKDPEIQAAEWAVEKYGLQSAVVGNRLTLPAREGERM